MYKLVIAIAVLALLSLAAGMQLASWMNADGESLLRKEAAEKDAILLQNSLMGPDGGVQVRLYVNGDDYGFPVTFVPKLGSHESFRVPAALIAAEFVTLQLMQWDAGRKEYVPIGNKILLNEVAKVRPGDYIIVTRQDTAYANPLGSVLPSLEMLFYDEMSGLAIYRK